MALESIPAYTGFRGGPVGQAYNEAAFRYFLDADRRRVERSGRSIILVLASIRQSPGRAARLPDATAAAFFAGLAAGVREVDFVGWVPGRPRRRRCAAAGDRSIPRAARLDRQAHPHLPQEISFS